MAARERDCRGLSRLWVSNAPFSANSIRCFEPLLLLGRGFQPLFLILLFSFLPAAQAQLIVETDTQSPFVAIQVWVRAGSADETPENNGVAHFIEHMIFKGTTTYPRGELDTQIEMRGGLLEATTERDWTRFYATVPANEWQPVLKILLEHLKSPAFPEEELEKERAVILRHEYARHESDPVRRLRYKLYAQAFEGDSYGQPVLGNPEVLTKLTRDNLIDFHRHYYHPSDFIIVLTGNVQLPEAQSVVKEVLTPAPVIQDHSIERKRFKAKQVTLTLEEKESDRVYIGYALPVPPAHSAENVLASQLFIELLATPSQGFLYTKPKTDEAKEKPLPFTALYPEYLPRIRGGVITLIFETKPDQVEPLKIHVESALARIHQLKQTELEAAQTRLRNLYNAESTTPSGRAYQLGLYSMLGLQELSKDYVTLLQKISLPGIRQFPVSPASGTTPSASPAPAPDRPSILPNPEPAQRHLLANGVRLIVLPVPGSKAVSVQAFMRAGVLEEEGYPGGIGAVLVRLLFGSTHNETPGTLRYRISAAGGNLTTQWEPQFTRIEMNIHPERLESALSLLSEGLFKVDFDKDAFLTAREAAVYALQDPRLQAFRQAQTLAQNALYGGHLYGQPFAGTPDSIASLTLQEVQRFYRAHYLPGNLIIVVAGDVKPERALNLVRRSFEEIESTGTPQRKPQLSPPNPQQGIKQAKTASSASYIMTAASLPPMDAKQYATARMLSAILGEGKGSRLFQNLREAHGIGYEFGSLLLPMPLSTFLFAYIQCEAVSTAETLQNTQDLILKQLKSLAENPPSEPELARAKRFLKFQLQMDGQNLSNLAYRLGLWESLGTGYEQALNLPAQIETVTAQQIQELAKECLQTVGMGVVSK